MGTTEQHDTSMQSPFAISHEDVEALNESEAFNVLRSYLARDAEYVLPPLEPYHHSLIVCRKRQVL